MTVQQRIPPGKYRLSVDDYRRLDEAGAFGGSRTELIGGDIIVMNAEYRPHARIKSELGYRLRRALEESDNSLFVMDGSVALTEHDLLQPDIVLTAEPYGDGPIPAASVTLVIEVSATTLQRDTGVKATAYAEAGIAEYWIVDVEARTIEQRWRPAADRYQDTRTIAFGGPAGAITLPGLTIATDRL